MEATLELDRNVVRQQKQDCLTEKKGVEGSKGQ